MIAVVVLAAGISRRMGRPKQLLKVGDKTILEHVVSNVLQTNASEVVVVLGKHYNELKKILSPYGVRCIYNCQYQSGIGTSVAAGAAAVKPEAQGIMFVAGDLPLLSTAFMNHMIHIFREKRPLILRPQNGMPTIFDISLRKDLISLTGDVGGRQLISKYQNDVLVIPGVSAPQTLDVDNEDDYRRLLYLFKRGCRP